MRFQKLIFIILTSSLEVLLMFRKIFKQNGVVYHIFTMLHFTAIHMLLESCYHFLYFRDTKKKVRDLLLHTQKSYLQVVRRNLKIYLRNLVWISQNPDSGKMVLIISKTKSTNCLDLDDFIF